MMMAGLVLLRSCGATKGIKSWPASRSYKPFRCRAKAGGGDGSRTHVRNTLWSKRYMFSSCLYFYSPSGAWG